MWLKETLHKIRVQLDFWRHKSYLKQKIVQPSADYEQYLDIQLQRTIAKSKTPLPQRTKLFVAEVAKLVPLNQCNILCVGCRNMAEIDYFQTQGAKSVVGIDLYSNHPEILVMDMHHMTFPDNQFDLVYSSHSLEHAYDVQQVVNEMVRVAGPGASIAIEMPVCLENQPAADRVDLEKLENLHHLFGPHIRQILYSEEQPQLSPRNDSAYPIIRTILTVDKV